MVSLRWVEAKEASLTGAKSSPFSMVTLLTSVSALVDCSWRSSLLATIWARLTAAEAMASQKQRQKMIDSLVDMMSIMQILKIYECE